MDSITSSIMGATIGDIPLLAIFAILVAIMIILVLTIVLIGSLAKSGKHLTLSLLKHGDKKDDRKDQEKTQDVKQSIISNIQNHKFFSYVRLKYVGVDYNLTFDNYEMFIEQGVKKESQEVQEFKKLVASRFLSECVFRYIFNSVKNWIENVLSESEETPEGQVPIAMCDIIEYLIHFTKETTIMSSEVRLSFNGFLLDGIPTDFVKYFCKIVNSDMQVIQDAISNIIYITDIPWYYKVIEILDILELVLVYIKDSVDSTLIVFDGQLEKYFKEED